MNRLAILGANSQIAKDLVCRLAAGDRFDLLLFVRDSTRMAMWLQSRGITGRCKILDYGDYAGLPHDAVINFVGVGDPRVAADMGSSIFDITARFDDMVVAGLKTHPERRYLFLSSGAVYGNSFNAPVDDASDARIPVNGIGPQDYYAAAKLHAEVRHRAHPDLAIVDLRVFNYFSRTQDIDARFLITDIVRATRDRRPFLTSTQPVVRDFLHPDDFHALVSAVLDSPRINVAIDCYSREPVDKATLLKAFESRFGLRFETSAPASEVGINATGSKPFYYSLSRKAARFGYAPSQSSLGGVLAEAAALLA